MRHVALGLTLVIAMTAGAQPRPLFPLPDGSPNPDLAFDGWVLSPNAGVAFGSVYDWERQIDHWPALVDVRRGTFGQLDLPLEEGLELGTVWMSGDGSTAFFSQILDADPLAAQNVRRWDLTTGDVHDLGPYIYVQGFEATDDGEVACWITGHLYGIDSEQEIYCYDHRTEVVQQVTERYDDSEETYPFSFGWPALSADGRRVAFEADAPAGQPRPMVVADLQTGQHIEIPCMDERCSMYTLSGDGTKVAISESNSELRTIRLVLADVDTTERHIVPRDPLFGFGFYVVDLNHDGTRAYGSPAIGFGIVGGTLNLITGKIDLIGMDGAGYLRGQIFRPVTTPDLMTYVVRLSQPYDEGHRSLPFVYTPPTDPTRLIWLDRNERTIGGWMMDGDNPVETSISHRDVDPAQPLRVADIGTIPSFASVVVHDENGVPSTLTRTGDLFPQEDWPVGSWPVGTLRTEWSLYSALIHDTVGGKLGLYEQGTSLEFEYRDWMDLPSGWVPIDVGDIDGDGRLDVTLWHEGSRTLGAWLVEGDRVFGWTTLARVPAGWRPFATTDLNSDHTADVALFHEASGRVGYWSVVDGRIGRWHSVTQLPQGVTPVNWMD